MEEKMSEMVICDHLGSAAHFAFSKLSSSEKLAYNPRITLWKPIFNLCLQLRKIRHFLLCGHCCRSDS